MKNKLIIYSGEAGKEELNRYLDDGWLVKMMISQNVCTNHGDIYGAILIVLEKPIKP